MKRFIVGRVGEGVQGQTWEFDTQDEAAEFISTFPEEERADGQFYLDDLEMEG